MLNTRSVNCKAKGHLISALNCVTSMRWHGNVVIFDTFDLTGVEPLLHNTYMDQSLRPDQTIFTQHRTHAFISVPAPQTPPTETSLFLLANIIAPDLLGNLYTQLDLGPLLLFSQLVTLSCGAESTLVAHSKLIETLGGDLSRLM